MNRCGALRAISRRWTVTAALLTLPAWGCANHARSTADNPDMAAFVEMMIPRSIEIQRYLTRPVDFAGSGAADGIEVILATNDSFGDPIKCVGSFQFELHELRIASGDRVGQRLAYWLVEIRTDSSLARHWERHSRFFRFPLQLDDGTLKPGRYVLSARFQTPTGEMLFDEYEFSHETHVSPAARVAP